MEEEYDIKEDIDIGPDSTIIGVIEPDYPGGDAIVVSVSIFKERKGVDIRRFYYGKDERYHPTQKGVRVGVEDAGHLAELIKKAE
ncbi:MAG: transcriptional coactivator p15/PC4 family protein [Actinobacteria bacterium]|nr:transcriptional coactivator p15/PC4 family protein [Actinomycetota bacterium]